jgi:hypothetical protein
MAVRFSVLRTGHALPPQKHFTVLIFVSVSQPQGHSAVTSSGLEPATFRLVAKCLNQLRCCVPSFWAILDIIHRSVIYLKLNSIGLSVPRRKHITSPLHYPSSCKPYMCSQLVHVIPL